MSLREFKDWILYDNNRREISTPKLPSLNELPPDQLARVFG